MRSRRHSSEPGATCRGLRDPERFDAWLYRLLANSAIEEARRRRRRVIEVASMASRCPAARMTSASFADRDALDRALAGLQPEHRALIVLHYYLGLPLPEAAAAMGISLGAAKSRLHRSIVVAPAHLRGGVRRGRRDGDGRPGMTASDRFDRVFADVLADLAQPAYPDYIDDVLDRATPGSQRPAWTFPERWLPMGTLARPASLAPGLPWRNLGMLALLALLAAAILAVAIGTQRRLAPPYGPAANGLIVYQVDGDIYVRTAIDGSERVLIGGDELDVYPFFSRRRHRGSRSCGSIPRPRGIAGRGRQAVYVAEPDGTRHAPSSARPFSATWPGRPTA